MISVHHTKIAATALLGLCLHSIVKASPYNSPTPTATFSGLRDSIQAKFEILPTPNPWSASELLKRLSGDPAICGWVDGDANNTVSCNSGYTCAATSTYVGCCSKGELGCQALFTTCYDTLGPSCSAACSGNSAALICDGGAPYCATYNYAAGSKGFGCAEATGYNKTVLTSPTDGGPTPFGGSSATPTSSSSSITASSNPTGSPTDVGAATATATATTPVVTGTHTSSLSGGAIAGIAIGAAVIVAMLAGIIWARIRRQRIKRQDTQAQRSSSAPYLQGGFMYPQYPKTEPGLHSPPMSPPLFSRDPSEQYGTPPQSEQGRFPYSVETLRDNPRTSPSPPFAIAELSQLCHSVPAELPAGEHPVDKKHAPRDG